MKKRRKNEAPAERSQAEYYKLNTKAVRDLVEADESNSPEVPEEELKKYRSVSRFKLSERFKLLFIKFWFPAAVCYFFFWGLGSYVGNMLDLLVITGTVLGIVTEMLTNNALRFFARKAGDNDRYMMFPQKTYITFPLNIIYAGVVLFLVFMVYTTINMAITSVTGVSDTVPLGVGPILFGLFYLGIDTLLIEAKHLCIRIVKDAKKKALQGD